MIYILFDNPADKEKMTFLNSYESTKILHIYPHKKLNSIKEMLVVCNDVIKRSGGGDAIICWYDFMLKSKKVQATVTSKNYGDYLNNMLGISKKYIILHDVYRDCYCISYEEKFTPNTVFCGGRNSRDWSFLIKIAQTMPDVTFNCVMTKDNLEQYKENFCENMVVKSDISEREFLAFMCQSQLVVMPLDTEAPAGLITFYQAAANGKMVITSDTVTTREYFANARGALCDKDIKDWNNKIRYYLQHEEEANVSAGEFKSFVESECSEERYAKALWRMLAE